MKYSEIYKLAKLLKMELSRYCLPDKCVIAGSIRRRSPECKDIEIVCIPDVSEIFNWANFLNGFEIVKGKPFTGKYIQIIYRSNIKADIFVATPENWGYMLALRTGSARFSHEVLAQNWCKMGYHSINGMITLNKIPIKITTEQELFDLLKIPFLKPEFRI